MIRSLLRGSRRGGLFLFIGNTVLCQCMKANFYEVKHFAGMCARTRITIQKERILYGK